MIAISTKYQLHTIKWDALTSLCYDDFIPDRDGKIPYSEQAAH